MLVLLSACTTTPSQRYIAMLDRDIDASRMQVGAMTTSAQEAAKRIVDGGRIWVAGPCEDFQIEAYIRASGLMELRRLGDQMPGAGDVVLYAAALLDEDDAPVLTTWRGTGAQVIAFGRGDAPVTRFNAGRAAGLMVNDHGERKLCPTDTVMNAVNLWAWTGEVAAACTRMGTMPTFFQSHGLPEGRTRTKRIDGMRFHDDMVIDPVAPGVLAHAYFDHIQSYLHTLRTTAQPQIKQATQWWLAAGDDAQFTAMGHMFPYNFDDTRAPRRATWFKPTEGKPLAEPPAAGGFVLYIGYQNAPAPLVQQAIDGDFNLVYASVRPADPRDAPNVMRFVPTWPVSDGCVTVPGYDVKILPASGIVNSAIYWSMMAELCSRD
jgi:hypothetical protein